MSYTPAPEISGLWERWLWRGERAWTSACGGVRAVVSEDRSRLIYLGAPDGLNNLLNAPWPRRLPSSEDPWPNQGGHRFWLGPQHRWVWPPPTEWEFSAAVHAVAVGAVLTLQHARLDSRYPALWREYSWEGGRLRCTVRWRDDGQDYFGLHVVAVDAPATLVARLDPRPEAPLGLVAARMVDPEPPLHLPQDAIAMRDGHATVCSGRQRKKFGFAPQTLAVARTGGWSLHMYPGPCSQPNGSTPDHGYLSQVWVGDASSDIAELEQLTPHLHGGPSGVCSTTIFIEAVPPAA